MYKRTLSAALAAFVFATPIHAETPDIGTQADRINVLFDQGFSGELGTQAEVDVFLEIATIAEAVLTSPEGLNAADIRDMHQQAANGYYYAAERQSTLAHELDEPDQVTSAMIVNLEKALKHHQIVFANGNAELLVAEYYFGTGMLLEHGVKTSDPRTKTWADAHLAAARLRIGESENLNIDINKGARQELVKALLDYHDATGDSAAKDEARETFNAIPEGHRSYDLKRRMSGYFPDISID